MADGKIVLSVEVDETGLNDALKNIGKKGISTSSGAIGKFGKAVATAFSISKISKFSNEASKLASSTEANAKRMAMLYGEAGKEVYNFANDNATAFGMSKTAAYEAASAYGNIFTTFTSGAESAELTTKMLQATAVIASQTGRTYDDVFEKIRSGLYGNTRAIDDLGLSVRQSSLVQTKAYKQISNNGAKSWNSLTDAELQHARALGVIEQATEKYGDTVMQSSALTRSQLSAAWEDFKATFGALLNVILVPAMQALTTVVNTVARGLEYLAKLAGVDASAFMSASKKITTAQEEQEEHQKAVNKEIQKTISGFDELNIIDIDTGATGGALPVATQEEAQPTASDEVTKEATNTMGGFIAGMTEMLVGIGLVALGCLLLMLGQIIWGIGCIIVGVAALGVAAVTLGNTGGFDGTEEALSTLMTAAGGALLAIGVLLCFFQMYAVGIAAIVAGIGLAVGGEVIGGETKGIEEWLTDIFVLLGGFMLCLGIILLFFGSHIVLGISLIVAGIGILAVKLVNESESVPDNIKKWVNIIMGILSLAALVIGVIMLSTGHVTPTAIGLVIAGAAGLATTATINWDTIKDKLKGTLGVIMGIVGGALLVLGVILVATGNIPLGVALIAAGAASLVAVAAANKDAILNWIKDAWKGIKHFFSHTVLGFLKDFVNGMIQGAEDFLNFITSGFRALWDGIAWLIEGAAGLIGFDIEIGRIPEIKLPRLATGAVIPANHEFLAVLGDQKHGTNIEAPLDTIKQALFEVMAEVQPTTGGEQTIYVPLYLDSVKVAEAVAKAGEKTGPKPVTGGMAYAR